MSHARRKLRNKMTTENTAKGQTPTEADSQGHCTLGDGSALEVQVIVRPAGSMIYGVVIRASDGLMLRQWTSSDEGWLKHDLFSGPLAAAFWRDAAPQGYTVISWNDQPNAKDQPRTGGQP